MLCHRALTAVPKNAAQPLIHKMLWDDVFTTKQLARSKDAALLLAADMPDFMGYAISAYISEYMSMQFYYEYFCAPDSIFLRDHQPEKPGIAQSCTSSKYYQL